MGGQNILCMALEATGTKCVLAFSWAEELINTPFRATPSGSITSCMCYRSLRLCRRGLSPRAGAY
jgi:hypothetical protein